MNRTEMIEFIRENPFVRVTHTLFGKEEYLYGKSDGRVYDEAGYLFEDWQTPFHNGLRIRFGDAWEQGWSLYRG